MFILLLLFSGFGIVLFVYVCWVSWLLVDFVVNCLGLRDNDPSCCRCSDGVVTGCGLLLFVLLCLREH